MTSTSPRARFRAALPLLSLLALPALLYPATAQTVVTAPTATTGILTPNSPRVVGMPVIVAAAIDTTGDADAARRALRAAQTALRSTNGYAPAGDATYSAMAGAAAKNGGWAWPFSATAYQNIGKASKMARAMTISVTPGGDGSYSAVAEMFDTKNGGIVGYGRGSSQLAEGALEASVSEAVAALGQSAVIPGIIVSKPDGGLARLSLGTTSGARGGARVEYLGENGEPIGVGTIIDIAAGEALATVAPETIYPGLFINQRVRLVSNPSVQSALPTAGQLFDKDYKQFERNFALSLGVAAAVYYLAIR
ncbi:MAG: hypothetical protein KY445_05280 [Armatimonadetes bacterium]|nr:hypothetical protein [Armatimonadota bacterium]